jgi:type IV secretory pathway TrbD component
MTAGALMFMIASWSIVLGLTIWAFARVLQAGERKKDD